MATDLDPAALPADPAALPADPAAAPAGGPLGALTPDGAPLSPTASAAPTSGPAPPGSKPPPGKLSERTIMMLGLAFFVFLVILIVFFYGSGTTTKASTEEVGHSTHAGRVQRARMGCILDNSESYPSLEKVGYCGKANDFINDTMMPGSVPPAPTLEDCAKSCTRTAGCNGIVWNTHDQNCIHHQFTSESDARYSEIHDGTGNYIFATRNATPSRPFA